MKEIRSQTLTSPLGDLIAGMSDKGLCFLEFEDTATIEQLKDVHWKKGSPNEFLSLQNQLNEYFNGVRTSFNIPLDLIGTDFQINVWNGLLNITYGRTRTYMEQSLALGDPKAIRAVASANGQNRIAIIIPCHRVIGSDGSLTGYAGKLWRKKHLLNLEQGQTTLF